MIGITPLLAKLREFKHYPIASIIIVFGLFGYVVWNENQRQEQYAREEKNAEIDAKKEFNKSGLLLLEASCDKSKTFRQLLVQNNIGQQYAYENYDKIYNSAKEQNKKNCTLLTRPVALAGVDGGDGYEFKDETIPDGWQATSKDGIYQKWCKVGECDTSKMFGDQKGAILMLWCKEEACGNIYGQVNLLNSNNVVIGFTNDTAYGGLGDKVQLTFSSYQDFSSMQLTEINFR